MTKLLLCQWHINKNVLARMKTGGYFSETETQQAWSQLWFAVLQASNPEDFQLARATLAIGDSGLTPHWCSTLYEYLLKEWLIEGTQEKHC